MDNKIILTIGRQFGSGGREIGQRLAKELGIGYYDKELITVAARESGLCEDVFEKADERASSGLSYAFTMGYSSFREGCLRLIMIFCLMTVFLRYRVTLSVNWRRLSRVFW